VGAIDSSRTWLGRTPVSCLVLLLMAVGWLVGASHAEATAGHSYDAGLSLVGGCNPNSASVAADPIPDPNCPGTPHPPKEFDNSCGVAVDQRGDLYVASSAIEGGVGRIDVFTPSGEYLTEIEDENQPCSLAVDSQGNVYVVEYKGKHVVRFEPEAYPPEPGTKYSQSIVYEFNPLDGCGGSCTTAWSVAVDPSDDHLYIGATGQILEYDSAANGLGLLNEDIGVGLTTELVGIDVYGKTHQVYATGAKFGTQSGKPENARVFIFNPAGDEIECEIDGDFGFTFGQAGIAVDQANGDVYVDDIRVHKAVKQYDSSCDPIGQLPAPPPLIAPQPFADIAADDPCLNESAEPCNPEAEYTSPNEGYVFVGSGNKPANSHLFAFKPKKAAPPAVKGQVASAITETEAVLSAGINPEGVLTTYHFQYTPLADVEYAEAISVPIPDADAGEAGSLTPVSVPIAGLQPGASYRFRVVASNEEGTTTGEGKPGELGDDATFSTYPAPPSGPCPNEALRIGPSASLPDCRAYELVTPADTNGRVPTMSEFGKSGSNFDTLLSTADGQGLLFGTEGGTLPGAGGGGFHDTYEAQRGEGGWSSSFTGLDGIQAAEPFPGGVSADHRYAFWLAETDKGSFAAGTYLRRPGGAPAPSPNCAVAAEPLGRWEWAGCGSLGTDPAAAGQWISEDGAQVIFSSRAQLEKPTPAGQTALYARTPGGATQILSLLPGDVTPTESAQFQGANPDGSAVVFKVGTSLYLRASGKTSLIATEDAFFAGISDDGEHVAYVIPKEPPKVTAPPKGKVLVYDAATETSTQVGSSEEAIVVNVSADASHVYFVSPGKGAGEEDLFVWDSQSEAVSFIATLSERDVFGEPAKGITEVMTDGLGLWAKGAVNSPHNRYMGLAADPSRTTPNGAAIVFESRADITGYASGGHAEIYRYDAASGEPPLCLSCNPSGEAAETDALLESPPSALAEPFPPLSAMDRILNVSSDGRRVFFQSGDRLVARDVDHHVDVYEWIAQGLEGCGREAGCLALISSGHSAADDFLYSVTPDGHDVFFETADSLVPRDKDGTSIYDARIDGGFAEAQAAQPPCQDAPSCHSSPPPPTLPSGSNGPFPGGGNVVSKACGPGKRKVRRGGKVHCLRRHHHAKHGRGHHGRMAGR
jgi:DNA-binding beta-propeller fold protein YncE